MSLYSEDVASSSDDEGAPEALSLFQSKQNAETFDHALNNFNAAEKERRKERNRMRDRKLKERAAQTRRTKRVEDEGDDAHARMERAMRDAEEAEEEEAEDKDEHGSESDSEDDFEGSSKEISSEESEDETMKVAEDEKDGIMESDDDESQDETGEGGSNSNQSLTKPKQNHHYLPDHLFTSAFTPQTLPSSSNLQSLASVSKMSNIVRKRKNRARAKDLIVGSRAIRTLSNSSRSGLPTSMTLPSPKVKKFVSRSLNIKGDQSRIKGWERRPANLGVSKRDGGPALGFVRGQQGVSS